MKKYLTLFISAGLSFIGMSQVTNYQLDINNANASISDGGVFMNFEAAGLPGNEIPAGSQLHNVFALGFWYGGVDVNGQLKLSAQKYAGLEDQFKGPLTIDGLAQADNTGAWSTSVFPVTKQEIEDHIANFMNPGYVVPQNIANWPAHGDIANGFDFFLSPFLDYDWDGNYDPSQGDHPCILGNKAVYVIMNDKGGVHGSGGDPIGIEMHYMFYQYADIQGLENVTFVKGHVMNRGTQTISDFKMSVFMDADIGFFGDDYFGSDPSRNLMYFYNGDNFDEPDGGSQGYLDAPPAVGVVSLSHDFESIGNGLSSTSSNAAQYWNLMNALSESGAPWIDPVSTNATNFLYADSPSSAGLNSELAQGNTPGDRRGIATIDMGIFTPNDVRHFDYAIVYNDEDSSNIDNAVGLGNVADFVQNFFDTVTVVPCNTNSIGLNETTKTEFLVSPNPTQGEFTISLESDFSDAQLEILDLSGRVVLDQLEITSTETQIELSNQPSGVYLLNLVIDGHKTTKRIIVE